MLYETKLAVAALLDSIIFRAALIAGSILTVPAFFVASLLA